MTLIQKYRWQSQSVNLQDSSSALVVFPLTLRPDAPLLTFTDLLSDRLPEVAEALAP